VATELECEQALHSLARRLAEVDPEQRAKFPVVERTVSCVVPDLGVVFTGRLDEEGLTEVRRSDDPAAQVRLAAASDDLVALSEGRLSVPAAWATGRLKIEASVLDLLKLRGLL
jgi:predicted lipid carrier protein YhbT